MLPDVLTAPDGRPVRDDADRAACRTAWLGLFARHLYGPIPPPPPDGWSITREPVAGEGCERLTLDLRAGERRFAVDAALWLPERRDRPVPLIVGLSFLGPAGVLTGTGFPLDPAAVVEAAPEIGLVGGRLAEQARGVHAARWPLPLILGAGFGLLLSCYGSWVPDHPQAWQAAGLRPFLGDPETGAISLWAWALQRLVDAARTLPEIDPAHIALAGHSRLGKAALWAAANDDSAAAVIVNNAGCAGPALSRRNFGETLAQLAARFPHWLLPWSFDHPEALPVDQHQLLACVAPRRLYVASASQDLWADPRGEYLALQAAAPFWSQALPPADAVWQPGRQVAAGPLAWHLRPGGHGVTPWDWRRFLGHLGGNAPALAGG